MAEIILRDLYCYICSLQFDGKLVYDMHQSILHKYKDNGPSFEILIKTEVSEEENTERIQNLDIHLPSENDMNAKHTVVAITLLIKKCGNGFTLREQNLS